MPALEAPPIAPKNDSGTEMTNAHGQDTTRNDSARVSQDIHTAPSLIPRNSGGTTASSTAPITTAGV